MTTIKIKERIPLQRKEYETADEFIETYLSFRKKVVLREVDESNLPDEVKNDLAESRQLGSEGLHDFQG